MQFFIVIQLNNLLLRIYFALIIEEQRERATANAPHCKESTRGYGELNFYLFFTL